MAILFRFMLAKRIFDWAFRGQPLRNPKSYKQRWNEAYLRWTSWVWWQRNMKIMAIPTGFYIAKLDHDPYDNRKKFYLFNPKNEKIIGDQLFKPDPSEYKEKMLSAPDSPESIFMNELLQYLLRKNGV